MHSATPSPNEPLGYAELESLLQDADATACAAECHGIVCGLVCAGAQPGEVAWIDEVLPADERSGQAARLCEHSLTALAQAEWERFAAEDYTFELLLPEDDAPLGERLVALSEWCAGFLFGFGAAAAGRGAELGEPACEFIGDMAKFTQVDTGAEDGDEENESAYAEIVEYIKAGALLVRDASCEQAARGSRPESYH